MSEAAGLFEEPRLYPQMAAESSRSLVRLNAVDRRGRKIEPVVFAAAEEVFSRALEHGLKLLGDPAVVANALEDVAATVSRVIRSKDPPSEPVPIRNLTAYVFKAFVRHVNRLKRKELAMISLADSGQSLSPPRWADPTRQLETKILVDECLAQCDFITQDMFWRRLQGFSWEEVGKIHDLSAHAAEARFSHAMRKARERLNI